MTSGFFYLSMTLNEFSTCCALEREKSFLKNMTTSSIYIIFLLTLLGTSTASGNVREEGKTFVIFTSALSTLISSMASSKRTGNVRQPVFSQANFAFAFKVYNCCAILSFKSVRVSLICLGLNLSGCCEMFSFWPNQLKKKSYLFG